MKLFTKAAKEMAKEIYLNSNRPLNIPANEWFEYIKLDVFDYDLDMATERLEKRNANAKAKEVLTQKQMMDINDILAVKEDAAKRIQFFAELRSSLIEGKVPGFIRQETSSENPADGLKRVKKAVAKVKRTAKKEGRAVESYPEFHNLHKEFEVLMDEKNPPIYKPELKLNMSYEYKRVSKTWLDGTSRGKGKEGRRESLGSSLVFESPVYKEHWSEKAGAMTKSIVAYDVILKVANGSLSAPAGIMSMVFSFLNTLVSKGVFKNNQLITRDQYGYTYLVQELVSDVGLDIAQSCGWVTMNSYRLMNHTFYQTIRSKQNSKKAHLERKNWLGTYRTCFMKLMRFMIDYAIDQIATNSDWAKANPDYAEDIQTFKSGYKREVVKYFLLANNSETLRVHNFKEKFPAEELDRLGVDADLLKELASYVKEFMRNEFGRGANAFTNLINEIEDMYSDENESAFIKEFISDEMNKNIGHKILVSADTLMGYEGTDVLALADNGGELITAEEALENLPAAMAQFEVSMNQIIDKELEEIMESEIRALQ